MSRPIGIWIISILAVAAGVLYLAGGRMPPAATGLLMVTVGCVLVGIAIALGG